MIDDLIYLYSHRYHPSSLSLYVKYYLKRIYFIPDLLFYITKKSLMIRKGAKLGLLCVVNKFPKGDLSNLSVGDFSVVGDCDLALHSKIIIGRSVVISDGTKLLTGSHDIFSSNWRQISSPIIIDDYVWLATGSILLGGSKVGRGVVVAAGSVVSGIIPSSALVKGNPAVIHENIRPTNLLYYPVGFRPFIEAWLGPVEFDKT